MQKSDLNYRDNFGNTKLMLCKTLAEIKEILEFDASRINDINIYSETVLMLALKENKNIEIIEHLIQAGANVNACTKTGFNVLDYCQNDKQKRLIVYCGFKLKFF